MDCKLTYESIVWCLKLANYFISRIFSGVELEGAMLVEGDIRMARINPEPQQMVLVLDIGRRHKMLFRLLL